MRVERTDSRIEKGVFISHYSSWVAKVTYSSIVMPFLFLPCSSYVLSCPYSLISVLFIIYYL